MKEIGREKNEKRKRKRKRKRRENANATKEKYKSLDLDRGGKKLKGKKNLPLKEFNEGNRQDYISLGYKLKVKGLINQDKRKRQDHMVLAYRLKVRELMI